MNQLQGQWQHELQTIWQAFDQVRTAGQRGAIATVVSTAGSVYRRPGARMLLTADGQRVGAISGGCLESDVWERAQPLIRGDSQPFVVQYDTTASDDVIWGLGLGCNGIVQVLIESLAAVSAQAQLKFMAECWQTHQVGAIATIFQVEGNVSAQVADRLFCKGADPVVQGITDPTLINQLTQDMQQALADSTNRIKTYTLPEGTATALIEVIQPPITLLVCGAGYDAMPVVQLAKQLGWRVTVIDHRSAFANHDRFPLADHILICHPSELPAKLTFNPRMVAVVMTHHYPTDRALLQTLLPSSLAYVGVLGPKRRTQQLLAEIQTEGVMVTEAQLQRLHAPVGLDIGAETPVEIALAIAAEIQAILNGRSGYYLRDREAPIHAAILAE